MTTRPPPPRYRVVERGRRLEVIDTHDGRPVGSRPGTPPPLPTGGTGEALARLLSRGERMPDGRYVLRTHSLFDNRGPRSIALAEGGTRLLLTAGIVVAMAAAVVLAAFAWLGIAGVAVAGVAIGMAIQHGRPLATRLLSRVGETVERGGDRPG